MDLSATWTAGLHLNFIRRKWSTGGIKKMKKIVLYIICICMALQITLLNPGTVVLSASSDSMTLQQGNSNSLMDLKTNITGDSGSGVTYLNSTEVINSTVDTKYKNLSPYLAIDGDISTYYSSGLYYNQASPQNDYIQIELPSPKDIYMVKLTPVWGGVSFPYDVEIQISSDGNTWTTVASKKNMTASSQEEVKISFGAKKSLKYLRVISKKLKPQGSTNYYAQYAEIQLMTPNGENAALISNGAKVSASNSLYGDLFDYETFFGDTIDTGVNWVNITNETAYDRYKRGISTEASQAEINNFKKLKDSGIKILYRFTNAPEYSEILADKDAAANRFIAAMTPKVEALKDYVDAWGLFGEINTQDNSRAADYAYVIEKVAAAIKRIDSDAKINFATAQFDYGWTKKLLDAGLDDCVDIIGVHIYKDIWPTLSYPEMAGMIIKDGTEIRDEDHTTYEQQVRDYMDLLSAYTRDIKVMITEVSEPEGLLDNAVGEGDVLAKWLTRQYTIDKLTGIDGTFWFTVDPISAPRIVTTLVNTEGERTQAWYALQNYNSVFSGTNKESLQTLNITGQTDNLKYGVFENETEYVIPYWYAVSFLEDFKDGLINVDLSDFCTRDVTAVDLLTGKEQKINIENGIAKNLIVKDYVNVLKIKKLRNDGNAWKEITETDGIGMGGNGHDTYTQISYSKDITSDGNGSAMIEWVGSGKDAQIALSEPHIPQIEGAAVKSITMDVYVPPTVGNSVNKAIGTTLAGYVEMSDGRYLNSDNVEDRVLEIGWNKVVFDAANGVSLPFFLWDNNNSGGIIYIDNVRVQYQYPGEVFDSFENYTDDWKASGYVLSRNTDYRYVKDGGASMKIEGTETGLHTYAFVSNFLYSSGINGKQIPKIDGFIPKTFGFWVYSDGAVAQFKPEGTEDWRYITESGWSYLEWNIPNNSGIWWNWDVDHFNQMVLCFTAPGNLYVDAMYVGYDGLKTDLSISSSGDTDRIKPGDIITVEASIVKDGKNAYPFDLIVALYGENGNLVGVQKNSFEISEDKNGRFRKSVGITAENNLAAYAQGYLWKGTGLMTPCNDKVILPYKNQ